MYIVYMKLHMVFFFSFFFLNRLHSCLCPPGLQCARWHSLLQYCTVRQPLHRWNLRVLGCGLLHDEQQTGAEGAVVVDVGAVVVVVHVVDLPSFLSNTFRFLIATSFPSFAALVHAKPVIALTCPCSAAMVKSSAAF